VEDPFRFADALGPAKIVHVHEPRAGLRAVVVVDNVMRGPALGGVRMAPDVSTEECVRLARAMTFKNAAAGLAHGGGKSVIVADPKMPDADKERIMRAFAQAIRGLDEYVPGPDMGTDERCMGWVHDEIGRAAGLPPDIGGIPLDEIGATGFGLAVAVDVARERCAFALRDARVAVQGFGAVGRHAARFLVRKGARLVAASDSRGTLWDPAGIDVEELVRVKAAGGSVLDYPRGEKADRDAIIAVACEVWIPAARPDVVTAANVDRLRATLVAQGANIPVSAEAETILHRRGVLSIPDFIANAGGVICAAVEYRGGTEKAAFETIEAKIAANTRSVLAAVDRDGVEPRMAAVDLARRRIEAAAALRRRF
jgi:glutamate dehydrogenase/leucine dehydrogenase